MSGPGVPVSLVARWCAPFGPCARTLKRWIRAGHIAGRRIGGRWYVARDDAQELRDGTKMRAAQQAAAAAHAAAAARRRVTP